MIQRPAAIVSNDANWHNVYGFLLAISAMAKQVAMLHRFRYINSVFLSIDSITADDPYYVAVLISRITSLARPPVRLSGSQ